MMKRLLISVYFCGLLILLESTIIFPQTQIEAEIRSQNKQLDQLRKEIESVRKELEKKSKVEITTLDLLNQSEKEISLVDKLLRGLEKEENLLEQQIQQGEKSLTNHLSEKLILQNRYAHRIVTYYKRGKMSNLDILLGSESMNQALYRYKYLKVMTEYDRKLYRRLVKLILDITSQQAELKENYARKAESIREQKIRKQELIRIKKRREKNLASVQRDKNLLQRALEEKKLAASKLQSIIEDLERERERRLAELERQRALTLARTGSVVRFSSLQGKLIWPTNGMIVSKFGPYIHPVLKTVTENTGIDIKAPAGSDVRVVMDGLVTTITWLRGYGNTIIVDHGDGFYTVYTHVNDVFVDVNDYVSAGDIIAKVGDSGSLDGAKLHFEIWGNQQKLNPEKWLAKR
jgi:septal ring factor EnvC (AmiA/AmiB activator)